MKDQLPILYSFRRCPYAMRARLAIAISDQKVALREVVLKDKPESMIECSEKGTVPVLVLADESVIDESLDIMKWALAINDPDTWLEKTGEDLVIENDSSFKKALDKYKYSNRHPEHSQQDYREQGELFLQKLEDLLSNQPYLSGNELKFVDMAILPFVRQFAHVDLEWWNASKYSNIKKWLNEFKDSPLFAQIMIKYPQWKAGDTTVIFPE